MSLSKKELIAAVADATGESQKKVTRVVDEVLNQVEKTLKKGERVDIFGFGNFSVVQKAERAGRNPSTGAPMVFPAKRVVKFSPATALKNALN